MNLTSLVEMNPEIAKIEGHELIEYGFVRVTGLKFYGSASGIPDDGLEIIPTVKNLGTWGNNNGFKVVITERGEVWLGFGQLLGGYSELDNVRQKPLPQWRRYGNADGLLRDPHRRRIHPYVADARAHPQSVLGTLGNQNSTARLTTMSCRRAFFIVMYAYI